LGDGLTVGLRQDGYAVDWVKDGVAADLALKSEPYDLLVLDLGLSRLSGLDVLARLRGRGQTLPVLILTARDATGDKVAGLDAGADDYVVKPVDLDELAAREFALLHLLLENAGRVMTRARLEASLYGWRDEPDSNALEVHIHHLRKKLGTGRIKTLRGIGYSIPKA